jgi:hypothetical protein
MLAEEDGFPEFAHGFWAAAYKITTGLNAPAYIDLSQPAIASEAYRLQQRGESAPRPKRRSLTQIAAPVPSLPDGGYWDEEELDI